MTWTRRGSTITIDLAPKQKVWDTMCPICRSPYVELTEVTDKIDKRVLLLATDNVAICKRCNNSLKGAIRRHRIAIEKAIPVPLMHSCALPENEEDMSLSNYCLGLDIDYELLKPTNDIRDATALLIFNSSEEQDIIMVTWLLNIVNKIEKDKT